MHIYTWTYIYIHNLYVYIYIYMGGDKCMGDCVSMCEQGCLFEFPSSCTLRCLSVSVYERLSVRTCVCGYVCLYVCVRVHLYVCMCVST